ncbi:MAG: 4-(cytidine 5'-diphospho)-2-C-methyl-D-erythritol kinase [Candidatus Cloacimonetes bacterium]|nr:4-(cytidine 5'-diphospho)-2-C-methyl-D-erythritol kinase [Candidatus Cloacimonadota bacterium]
METNKSTLFCPAKINLGLHVLNKRGDGFHDIDTIFVPVSLGDSMSVEVLDKGPDIFFCNPEVCLNGSNLVVQCLNSYREIRPDVPCLNITLTKSIPAQAGLGGGSSDAASMLLWLYRNFPIPSERLSELALSLGSDVPFFLNPTPSRGQGRGEILNPLKIHKEMNLLIVKPDEGISTRQAFLWLHQNRPGRQKTLDIDSIVDAINNESYHSLFDLASNQFTDCFLSLLPNKRFIPEFFKRTGADYYSLTGSGSAWYGIYSDSHLRLNAYRQALVDCQVFLCTSLNSIPS